MGDPTLPPLRPPAPRPSLPTPCRSPDEKAAGRPAAAAPPPPPTPAPAPAPAHVVSPSLANVSAAALSQPVRGFPEPPTQQPGVMSAVTRLSSSPPTPGSPSQGAKPRAYSSSSSSTSSSSSSFPSTSIPSGLARARPPLSYHALPTTAIERLGRVGGTSATATHTSPFTSRRPTGSSSSSSSSSAARSPANFVPSHHSAALPPLPPPPPPPPAAAAAPKASCAHVTESTADAPLSSSHSGGEPRGSTAAGSQPDGTLARGMAGMTGSGTGETTTTPTMTTVTSSPRLLHTISHHATSVLSMAVCLERGLVFSGGQAEHIYVWDLVTHLPRARLEGHTASVLALELATCRPWLFSASGDSTVRVWDTRTLRPLYVLHPADDVGGVGDIFALKWVEPEEVLYLGCQNTSLQWFCFKSIDSSPAAAASAGIGGSMGVGGGGGGGGSGTASPLPLNRAPHKFFDQGPHSMSRSVSSSTTARASPRASFESPLVRSPRMASGRGILSPSTPPASTATTTTATFNGIGSNGASVTSLSLSRPGATPLSKVGAGGGGAGSEGAGRATSSPVVPTLGTRVRDAPPPEDDVEWTTPTATLWDAASVGAGVGEVARRDVGSSDGADDRVGPGGASDDGATSSASPAAKAEVEPPWLQVEPQNVVPYAHHGYIYALALLEPTPSPALGVEAAAGVAAATAAAASPDSSPAKILVSGSGDEDVKLWACTSRGPRLLQTLRHGANGVLALASWGTSTLFAGLQSGHIDVWDAETASVVRTLESAHDDDVLSLSTRREYGCHADGGDDGGVGVGGSSSWALYSAGADGTVKRWDSAFRCTHAWRAHPGAIALSCVALGGPRGGRVQDHWVDPEDVDAPGNPGIFGTLSAKVLSGGSDNVIRVWDVPLPEIARGGALRVKRRNDTAMLTVAAAPTAAPSADKKDVETPVSAAAKAAEAATGAASSVAAASSRRTPRRDAGRLDVDDDATTQLDSLVRHLARFVAFRSVSADEALREECRQCAHWLKSHLADLGAETWLAPSGAGEPGRNPVVVGVFRANDGANRSRTAKAAEAAVAAAEAAAGLNQDGRTTSATQAKPHSAPLHHHHHHQPRPSPLGFGLDESGAPRRRPLRVLCYFHYDVVAPGPLSAWTGGCGASVPNMATAHRTTPSRGGGRGDEVRLSHPSAATSTDATAAVEPSTSRSPWQLTGRDGYLYGRGVSDDKGPCLATAYAASELLRGGRLGCDVVMLVEGEEEAGGGGGLERAVEACRKRLGDIDVILVSNSYWLGEDTPCLTTGLRGVVHADIEVDSGRNDAHSGVDGGAMREPMLDMIKVLAELTDGSRVLLPGFYSRVRAITEQEREAYASLAKMRPGGRDTAESLMARWRLPSLSVHGVRGGAGDGETVIPSRVTASVSMRLVPDQDLDAMIASLRSHVQRCFESLRSPNRLQLRVRHRADWWLGETESAFSKALAKAVEDEWEMQRPVALIREGGSIPAIAMLERQLSAQAVHLPMGQSSDGAHLADERIRLENLARGRNVVRRFLESLARLGAGDDESLEG